MYALGAVYPTPFSPLYHSAAPAPHLARWVVGLEETQVRNSIKKKHYPLINILIFLRFSNNSPNSDIQSDNGKAFKKTL